MLVTDVRRIVSKGKVSERKLTGFYMDGYLAENLEGIPGFLSKAWDSVGIISGHGKVRIGKSTMAMQIAYYIAWLLAGGKMVTERQKGKRVVLGMTRPTKKVRFNLKENVVFSADDLQETANKLYKKYGKNQVIVYDEGRQGLDSARAMENINKGMEDFFQECGFMGHVILIVLPNFFKLHEDYAVARSMFLIDVFHDKHFNRGFFNFYNDKQKEWLYFMGKKKLGTSQKYNSSNPNFWGRFGQWLPFDKDEYEELKRKAMEKKRLSRSDRRIRLQRDILIWLAVKKYDIPVGDITADLAQNAEIKLSEDHLRNIISKVNDIRVSNRGYNVD